jgi:hypothetical protein
MVRVKNNTLMIELPEGSDARMIEEITAFVNKKIKKPKEADMLGIIEQYHRIGKRLPFKREDVYHERTCLR